MSSSNYQRYNNKGDSEEEIDICLDYDINNHNYAKIVMLY
jgi:hypothetical protein